MGLLKLRILAASVFILLTISLGGNSSFFAPRVYAAPNNLAPADPPPSTVSPFQPNVKWDGRSVAVDVSPANSAVAIAASESGGLFKTTDSGSTWSHIDSLPPFRMNDVKFAPSNASVIIASAIADTHTTNQGGIWRSTDAGVTWQKPTNSTPPPCVAATRPSGLGISFAPDTNDVYVGTDCGVAVSHDGGTNWTHFPLSRTWDVVASPGGIVDTCSDDGHHRSTNNGQSFGAASGPACVGYAFHGIDASPFESNVLFSVSGGPGSSSCLGGQYEILSESDDNGTSWSSLGQACNSRSPWVRVHPSTDGILDHFDLYFSGGLDLRRETCTGFGGTSLRCPPLPGTSNVVVDHSDINGMAFTTSSTSNCPEFVVSDGGVHVTKDCGANWTITGAGNAGYNAYQVYSLVGEVLPGQTDLYFGAQDDNGWAAAQVGNSIVGSWAICCADSLNFQVQHNGTTNTGDTMTGTSCVSCSNFYASALFSGGTQTWINPPGGGGTPFLVAPGEWGQWSKPNSTSPNHLYFTKGIPSSNSSWTDTGVTLQNPYELPYVATASSGVITFYQPILRTDGTVGLANITGIGTGTVTQGLADNGLTNLGTYADGEGTFGDPVCLGVDPHNPQHLIVADAGTNQMKVSTNGGGNWTVDSALTNLVTANGKFDFYLTGGIFAPFQEAHVVAFDPNNGNRILVGTEAAGIIASVDGGQNWFPMFGSDQVPAITSFFFDEGQKDILVSSYGRGLWKVSFAANLSVSKFYTDTSLNPLPSDIIGNPTVSVVIGSGLVKGTNPGGIIAWINVTNTGSLPIDSLKLNETLPVDWVVTPKWLPSKGAVHVFLVNSTSLSSNMEITQPSTVTVTTGNPQIVRIAQADFTSTAIGHPILPGQSILLSVKLTYRLVGTLQSPSTYPRNYTDTAITAGWTQISFSGGMVVTSGSAVFVADAKVVS